jgi:hypothetical protein
LFCKGLKIVMFNVPQRRRSEERQNVQSNSQLPRQSGMEIHSEGLPCVPEPRPGQMGAAPRVGGRTCGVLPGEMILEVPKQGSSTAFAPNAASTASRLATRLHDSNTISQIPHDWRSWNRSPTGRRFSPLSKTGGVSQQICNMLAF